MRASNSGSGFKQCVIADSSSDFAPKMIGDKLHTEASDPPVRVWMVGERSGYCEAVEVTFSQVRGLISSPSGEEAL